MSGGLILEIDTIDQLGPALRRAREAALNLSEPMADLSAEFLSDHLDRFNLQIDPEGVPWKRSKAASAEGRPTLRKSGDLFNAIERDSGQDFAAVGVYETGGPAEYARIHQHGGTIKHPGGTAFFERDGKAVFVSNDAAQRFGGIHGRELPRTKPHDIEMPRRSFIGFTDENVELTHRVLSQHIQRAWSDGGAA